MYTLPRDFIKSKVELYTLTENEGSITNVFSGFGENFYKLLFDCSYCNVWTASSELLSNSNIILNFSY